MRKPDRTESPAVAALLLSSDLRLLVCHARASGGWLLLTCGAIVGPALGVWRGRQDGFPVTGYCILAKQQQAAAAGSWQTTRPCAVRVTTASGDYANHPPTARIARCLRKRVRTCGDRQWPLVRETRSRGDPSLANNVG